MDTDDLSEAELVCTTRLTENVARLDDLENELRRFKAKIARLEAENTAPRTRVQPFDDEKDSVQIERPCSKEHTQAGEHQEPGLNDVPKSTQSRKETIKEGRKEPIGVESNKSFQIDSQNILSGNEPAEMEKSMTGISTTITEQPLDDDQHYHAVLPMSASDFDEVWERVKHSLQNIIVDIPQMLADRHNLSRPEELIDLQEMDEELGWEMGYFRIF